MSHWVDKALAVLLILETGQLVRTSCVCDAVCVLASQGREEKKDKKNVLHKDVY